MASAPKIPGLDAFMDNSPGTRKPPTPRTVSTAALLLIVAACVQVVASVVAVIHAASPERAALLEEQRAAMTGKVPSLESLQNMGVITVVLAGIATVCAYVLFAFFLNKGRSWARVAVGVLAALTCVQLVGIAFPIGYTTVAQLALGALAFGLCYLPESSKFFAIIKSSRK